MLPQSADNFTISGRLAEAGVAQVLMPGEVTAPALRAGLRSVLEVPIHRQRAHELAEEMALMPSPEDVAAKLRARVEEEAIPR